MYVLWIQHTAEARSLLRFCAPFLARWFYYSELGSLDTALWLFLVVTDVSDDIEAAEEAGSRAWVRATTI